jgi:hypothetical protein
LEKRDPETSAKIHELNMFVARFKIYAFAARIHALICSLEIILQLRRQHVGIVV